MRRFGAWKPNGPARRRHNIDDVVSLSPEADRHVADLEQHYEALDRLAAVRNLLRAVERAKHRIARDPEAGLPAPRPYPKLRRPGRLWIKEGRYWIAYNTTRPPVISGVFFETVDIPGWV